MAYKITPKDANHITERMTYEKDNKQFHCGFLWKTGSFHIEKQPTFLESYEREIGVSVNSYDFSEVSLSSDGEKLIYFSETTPQEEQDLLLAIFNNSKTIDDFDIAYQHKGWQLVEADIVMWGELELTEC